MAVFPSNNNRPSLNSGLQDILDTQLAAIQQRRTSSQARDAASSFQMKKLQYDNKLQAAATMMDAATPTESENSSWWQNVMGALEFLDRPAKRVVSKLVLPTAFKLMPGEQAGERALKELTNMSWNPFDEKSAIRAREALGKTKLPFGVMTTLEILADPLNLAIGLSPAVRAKKALQLAMRPAKVKKQEARVRKFKDLFAKIREGEGIAPGIPKQIELGVFVNSQNKMRKLGEHLMKVPGLTRLIGTISPQAAATTPGGRAAIIHGIQTDIGENLSQIAVSKLAATPMPFVIKNGFVVLDEPAVWKTAGKRGVQGGDRTKKNISWRDLFEYADMRGPGPQKIPFRAALARVLSPEQKEWIRAYRRSVDEVYARAKKEGISIKELGFDPGSHYIPRQLLDKKFSSSPAMRRIYKYAEDMMNEGIDFVDNPLEVLGLYHKSLYRMMADKDLVDTVKPLATTLKSRGDAYFPAAREILATNQKTLRELQAAEKFIARLRETGIRTQASIEKGLANLDSLGLTTGRTGVLAGVQVRKVLSQGVKRPTYVLEELDSDIKKLIAGQEETIKINKREIEKGIRRAKIAVTKSPDESFVSDSARAKALKGYVFDADTAESINRAFAPETTADWLRNVSTVNATARLGATAFDLGAGMIQGLPLLTRNPVAWSRAMGRMVQAFFDPKALQAYKNANRADLSEMAMNGVPLSNAEWVEAASTVEKGLRKPRARYVGGHILAAGIERGAAAFNAFGDAARLELWRALKPMAQNSGRPEALRELGDFVSKITGVSGRRKLGVSATQQMVEQSLFFAPRYYRATVGLLADVAQGGLRGHLARDAMLRMLSGGLLLYSGIAIAKGEEPKLDPTKADFLTYDAFGNRVGFGSIWISLLRTIGDTAEQIERNPEDIVNIDPQKSILARAIRYKGSPLTSLGWDIALGKDAIGKPLDTPIDWSERLLGSALPFWVQGFIPDGFEDISPGGRVGAALSEFGGMRAFPTSVFQRRELRRENLAQSLPEPRRWNELSGYEQKYLSENDTELTNLDMLAHRWGVERGDDVQKLVTEYLDLSDEFNEDYVKELEVADKVLKDKPGSGRDFRTKVKEAGAILRARFDYRKNDPRFDAAQARLEEGRAQNKLDGTVDPVLDDILYQEYLETIVLSDDLEDAYGDYLFDEAERRKELLQNKYGDEAWTRLEVRLEHGSEVPPSVREWRTGLDIFGYYFTRADEIAEQLGVLDVWQQYKELPAESPEALRMEKQWPIGQKIKLVKSQSRKLGTALRTQSPALDAYLYKFGYTTTLNSTLAKQFQKEVVQSWDFDTLRNLPMSI